MENTQKNIKSPTLKIIKNEIVLMPLHCAGCAPEALEEDGWKSIPPIYIYSPLSMNKK